MIDRREAGVRVGQAVLLYLLAGVLLLSGPFVDTQAEHFPQTAYTYWWWVTELLSWPTWLPPIGVAYYAGVAVVSYWATVAFKWVYTTFRETLANVPSRRTFLGFLVLAATVGVGVGLADPGELQDHAVCQDLPETADVSFEGVYKRSDAEQAHVYIAGGHHQVWFYDMAFGEWYVMDFESGYGRTGYAYEATVEWGEETAYIIANDTSLTVYRKNETAIGTQGASLAEQYEFVAKCRGEMDG